MEFETVEDGKRSRLIEKLIQGPCVAVFNRYFNVVDMEVVVTRFNGGMQAEVSDGMASDAYVKLMKTVDGLSSAVAKLDPGAEPGADRQRDRVHLRRTAPEQAAEQGQGRPEDAVPGGKNGSATCSPATTRTDGT